MADCYSFYAEAKGFKDAAQAKGFISRAYELIDPPSGTDGGLEILASGHWMGGSYPKINWLPEDYEYRYLRGTIDLRFGIRRGCLDDGLCLLHALAQEFDGVKIEAATGGYDAGDDRLDTKHWTLTGDKINFHDWRLAPPSEYTLRRTVPTAGSGEGAADGM